MKQERSTCPKNSRRTLNLWKVPILCYLSRQKLLRRNVRATNAVKAGHTIRRKVDLLEIASHGGVRHKYGYYAKCCRTKSSSHSRSPPKRRRSIPRETPSSSDDGYGFRVETPVDKVSAPFVSLKVNGVKCNFLVDPGATENILSLSASKVCNVKLKSCDTRVYVYNSSDPFHVLGKFFALVESKCSAVNSGFLLRTANAVSVVDRLKNSPTSDDVMAYFDPRKKTVLLVDASPVGLGAVLTQDGKVNSYGSKAHSSKEKRYS